MNKKMIKETKEKIVAALGGLAMLMAAGCSDGDVGTTVAKYGEQGPVQYQCDDSGFVQGVVYNTGERVISLPIDQDEPQYVAGQETKLVCDHWVSTQIRTEE